MTMKRRAMRMIRPAVALVAALTLSVAAAACSSSGKSSSSSGKPGSSSTAQAQQGGTLDEQWVGGTPNDIFPVMPATNTDGYNQNLQLPLWAPLVYSGDGGQSIVNQNESLFSSITYS